MQRILRLVTILSGSVLAQAISLVSLLFITKLYNPLEYGQFAAIVLIHSAALPLVLLRLDTFLIVSKELAITKSALQYSKQILSRLTMITALCFLVLFFAMPGNVYVVPQVYVIVLVSFISNVLNSILYYLSRTTLGAYSSVIQAAVTGILQVFFSTFSTSSQSLLIAFVLGRIAGMVPFIFYFKRNLIRKQAFLSNKQFRETYINSDQRNYQWSQIFAFFESMLNLFPVLLCIFVFNSESLGPLMLILVISSGPATMLVGSLTLAELTHDVGSSFRNRTFHKIIVQLYFLTNSRIAAIIYFLAMTFFAFMLRYFGFLNTDLVLFTVLVLAFALHVASTNDFAKLIAASQWILLTKVYFLCFLISSFVTVIALFLSPNTTLLLLISFYLSKSLTLFLTLGIIGRRNNF